MRISGKDALLADAPHSESAVGNSSCAAASSPLGRPAHGRPPVLKRTRSSVLWTRSSPATALARLHCPSPTSVHPSSTSAAGVGDSLGGGLGLAECALARMDPVGTEENRRSISMDDGSAARTSSTSVPYERSAPTTIEEAWRASERSLPSAAGRLPSGAAAPPSEEVGSTAWRSPYHMPPRRSFLGWSSRLRKKQMHRPQQQQSKRPTAMASIRVGSNGASSKRSASPSVTGARGGGGGEPGSGGGGVGGDGGRDGGS